VSKLTKKSVSVIILGIKSVLFQNKVVGYLSNEFVTTYLGLGFDFDHAHYKGIVAPMANCHALRNSCADCALSNHTEEHVQLETCTSDLFT
jgi:hypothetical protein